MTEDQDMDGEREYHDEDYEEGEHEQFIDEDVDEEAEAVAKQLGEALWADINKAYAQQGAAQPAQFPRNSDTQARLSSPHISSYSLSEGDDEQTLVNAVQTVLDFAAGHALLNEVLSDTIVPGTKDESLLYVLTEAAGTKAVAPELADTLSTLIQAIADGELFNPSGNAVADVGAEDNQNGGSRQ